jgi:hypothetical protein
MDRHSVPLAAKLPAASVPIFVCGCSGFAVDSKDANDSYPDTGEEADAGDAPVGSGVDFECPSGGKGRLLRAEVDAEALILPVTSTCTTVPTVSAPSPWGTQIKPFDDFIDIRRLLR